MTRRSPPRWRWFGLRWLIRDEGDAESLLAAAIGRGLLGTLGVALLVGPLLALDLLLLPVTALHDLLVEGRTDDPDGEARN